MARPAFTFSPDAPRKAVNVAINAEILEAAKGLGINLSQTLEARIVEILRARAREEWIKDNETAIAAYNRRVARKGVFSDGVRRF